MKLSDHTHIAYLLNTSLASCNLKNGFRRFVPHIIRNNNQIWSSELDQLNHLSSITITPSNVSITLQLLCAENIKSHYFHTCNWLQVEITNSFKNMKMIYTHMLEWFRKWCQNRLFASFREQPSLSFSLRIQQFFAYFDNTRIPCIHRAAVSYFLQMLLQNGRFISANACHN